jgi:hypothetical protein
VDAEQDVAIALIEIQGPGAERVVEPGLAVARQIRLELHHRGGRAPVRPDAFAPDIGHPLPGEALPADPDGVAHRRAVALDEVEEALVDIDHDRARALRSGVGDGLTPVLRLHPAAIDERHREGLVVHRADIPAGEIAIGRKSRHAGVAGGKRRPGEGAENDATRDHEL